MLTMIYIKEHKDWYFVTNAQVRSHGGSGLLHRYKGLIPALQVIYPEHTWDSHAFLNPFHRTKGRSTASKVQHLLFQYIQRVSNGIRLIHDHIYFQHIMSTLIMCSHNLPS